MPDKRIFTLFFTGLFLLIFGFISLKDNQPSLKPPPSSAISPTVAVTTSTPSPESEVLGEQTRETVLVVKVIDGDTIAITGGKKVRYIGINTPETVDPRRGVQCFGKEASQKNKELVEGKQVQLEKDVSETDKFGRLLRYIYVDNLFVNDYLVRNGYAYVSSYPPDVKYQEQFAKAQSWARENNQGLWASCYNK